MLLKVKLTGSGKRGDAYGVDLPTYQLIHGNITKGYAIVHVPDNTHDLTPQILKHEEVEETTEGLFYPSLCPTCIDRFHASLDKRYAEHKGEFRIEIPT